MKILLLFFILFVSLNAFSSLHQTDEFNDEKGLRLQILEAMDIVSTNTLAIHINYNTLLSNANKQDYISQIDSDQSACTVNTEPESGLTQYYTNSSLASCSNSTQVKHCNATTTTTCNSTNNDYDGWDRFKFFIPKGTTSINFNAVNIYAQHPTEPEQNIQRPLVMNIKFIDKKNISQYNQVNAIQSVDFKTDFFSNKLIDMQGPNLKFNFSDTVQNKYGWTYLSLAHTNFNEDLFAFTSIDTNISMLISEELIKWIGIDNNFKANGDPYDLINDLNISYTKCTCTDYGLGKTWTPNHVNKLFSLNTNSNANPKTYNGLLFLAKIISFDELQNGISQIKYNKALEVLTTRYGSSNIDNVAPKLLKEIKTASTPITYWIDDENYVDDIVKNLNSENSNDILNGLSKEDLIEMIVASGIGISIINKLGINLGNKTIKEALSSISSDQINQIKNILSKDTITLNTLLSSLDLASFVGSGGCGGGCSDILPDICEEKEHEQNHYEKNMQRNKVWLPFMMHSMVVHTKRARDILIMKLNLKRK